jgi:hypothetical protein
VVAAFLLLCCGAEPEGYEVVNRTPAYEVVNRVPASGVVSGPTVSPDGYYELRRAWDGATWVQTWELRRVGVAAPRPFAPGSGTTPPIGAGVVAGWSQSSPAPAPYRARTFTGAPAGTVGSTNCASPFG